MCESNKLSLLLFKLSIISSLSLLTFLFVLKTATLSDGELKSSMKRATHTSTCCGRKLWLFANTAHNAFINLPLSFSLFSLYVSFTSNQPEPSYSEAKRREKLE